MCTDVKPRVTFAPITAPRTNQFVTPSKQGSTQADLLLYRRAEDRLS